MSAITYSYLDVPTVEDFADDNHFIRGLMGPFGSGKSSGCVVEIIKRAHEQAPGLDGIRRTRWAIIRNTYQQLKDTSLKTFLDWVPESEFGKYYVADHKYVITGFPGCEIEVLFRALDRPDQVANLLSLELTGAWVNEAREVPWAIIEALQGRVGRYPSMKDGGPTWCGIFMDTNPPEEDSWWFDLFEVTRPNNCAIFKQPSGMAANAENLTNLRKNYYADMLQTMKPEKAKVYVHGQYGFIVDGKPVYPEYNDTIHCTDGFDYVPGLPIYRGWDFGLTPACVFSQITPNGRWQIFDELVATSLGFQAFADQVLLHCNMRYPQATYIDTGDPAGAMRAQTDENTCFLIAHSKQIMMEPGLQDPQIRQESVRKPLTTLIDGRPQLQLHPRCKMLRKGFMGGYQFRRMQVSGERFADVPDKNMYSHPHDGLQYTATRLFGGQVVTGNVKSAPLKYPNMRHV